jgi:hypothetical protein
MRSKNWVRVIRGKNFGLLGTFWTIMVENPSFSEWNFDRGDFGLMALLYFRNFSGGNCYWGILSALNF